jgi:hypothetical protein
MTIPCPDKCVPFSGMPRGTARIVIAKGRLGGRCRLPHSLPLLQHHCGQVRHRSAEFALERAHAVCGQGLERQEGSIPCQNSARLLFPVPGSSSFHPRPRRTTAKRHLYPLPALVRRASNSLPVRTHGTRWRGRRPACASMDAELTELLSTAAGGAWSFATVVVSGTEKASYVADTRVPAPAALTSSDIAYVNVVPSCRMSDPASSEYVTSWPCTKTSN